MAEMKDASTDMSDGDVVLEVEMMRHKAVSVKSCIVELMHIVFRNLNWTIQPQQHWQVTGPNGSGKTCLLNLITGDHPQCYVNDIYVFGYQRGSGESIWQIKHMAD